MTLRGRRPKEQDNKDKIQDKAQQESLKSNKISILKQFSHIRDRIKEARKIITSAENDIRNRDVSTHGEHQRTHEKTL